MATNPLEHGPADEYTETERWLSTGLRGEAGQIAEEVRVAHAAYYSGAYLRPRIITEAQPLIDGDTHVFDTETFLGLISIWELLGRSPSLDNTPNHGSAGAGPQIQAA